MWFKNGLFYEENATGIFSWELSGIDFEVLNEKAIPNLHHWLIHFYKGCFKQKIPEEIGSIPQYYENNKTGNCG